MTFDAPEPRQQTVAAAARPILRASVNTGRGGVETLSFPVKDGSATL